MSTQTVYKKYKETQVKTANQGKLVVMLYQGAIKYLRIAKKHINEDNINEANNALIRAQDIIIELNSTLDEEKGGELAQNLSSLYDYMKRRLIEANIKKDKDLIDEVEELLSGLLESWKKIINTSNDSSQKQNFKGSI